MKLETYKDEKPTLKLDEFFAGDIEGWGMIQDFKGEVISRFDVQIKGTFDGDTGKLEEDFQFYNGKTQQRTWNVKRVGPNSWEGTAGDIIGTAQGTEEGNAINWHYKMDVPQGGSTIRLKFDDWMFLMNDGVLMNRTYMKKFGITVAELTILMKKKGE